MIKIPKTARIAWNTLDNKTMERSDQESVFLATFDDPVSNTPHKFQIDYSYYNRGKYADAPQFVLHIYAFGEDRENYSDTAYYFDKAYQNMDDANDDINHWLQVFHEKVVILQQQQEDRNNQKSTLSLNLVFRADTPTYVTDFFTKSIKDDNLPSILYNYGFIFDNKPNFFGDTTMQCIAQNGRFHLYIYHRFDFDTEAAEGYWFVGGLAQYAENSKMAGYISHNTGNAGLQIFGFRDKMCFWRNDVDISFNSVK
jgi:hypothetical protein